MTPQHWWDVHLNTPEMRTAVLRRTKTHCQGHYIRKNKKRAWSDLPTVVRELLTDHFNKYWQGAKE